MFRPALRAPACLVAMLPGLLLGLLLAAPAATAAPDESIEDYAAYQAQTKCRPQAKVCTTYSSNTGR